MFISADLSTVQILNLSVVRHLILVEVELLEVLFDLSIKTINGIPDIKCSVAELQL